jgi:hypothetical protein
VIWTTYILCIISFIETRVIFIFFTRTKKSKKGSDGKLCMKRPMPQTRKNPAPVFMDKGDDSPVYSPLDPGRSQ